ncbi:MAG: hypothetical protein DRJ42_02080 [Deltaproteobacteria bacterium]|nr:MAG: hypothetical protein DRJ42_02080 [Deltaproteobacteria bacterium]
MRFFPTVPVTSLALFLVTSIVTGCDEERPPVPGADSAVADSGAGPEDSGAPDAADASSPRDGGLDACQPECGGLDCGEDGCGGVCGECAAGDTCAPEGTCRGPVATLPCPPVGPYGTSIGDVAPDVTLLDCDGVEHRLHDLCEAPVSWVFEFAEWCPTCRAFAPTVQTLYERHQPDGLEAYVVIAAAADFGPPDAALCAEVRDRYGFTMPVLYDTTGAFDAALDAPGNDYNLIMTEGMQLRYEAHYGDSTVEAQLADAFAAVAP